MDLIPYQELRRARQDAGLSLREMARRACLSAPYLSDVERGNRRVTRRVAEAYARAIDGFRLGGVAE